MEWFDKIRRVGSNLTESAKMNLTIFAVSILVLSPFAYAISDAGQRELRPKEYWTEQKAKIVEAISAKEKELDRLAVSVQYEREQAALDHRHRVDTYALDSNTQSSFEKKAEASMSIFDAKINSIELKVDRTLEEYQQLLDRQSQIDTALSKL
jgi:hypothetical protein